MVIDVLDITNPATGALVKRVEADTPATIAAKAAAARRAQPAWWAAGLDARLAAIRAFRTQVVARRDELARTLTSEMGKPIAQARRELDALLPRLDFFVSEAPIALREEEVGDEGSMREVVAREPLGVVANISAWNYPYFVGANVFVPALLAGNAVLYKPSEFATLTGLHIAEMMHAAGVPRDVFAPIIGAGEVGAALVEQPLDGIFFTGSVATGRRIAEAAAKRMIHVQLELGGKDPAYVAEDADISMAAASLADGAFYNTGQSCCSVERIYVHASIHDKFVDAFLAEVKSFALGDPTSDATYIGPLARAAQIGVLEAQVADALAKGARLRCGGRKETGKPGNWFEPTVLTDVTSDMRVMREESFGPIIGIQRARDDEDAVRLMNDTEFGLTAGVYTPHEARARKLLARVNAGSAYWNCCDRVSPRLPWSGRGHSGLGVTLGREGIVAMTRPKAYHLRRG